MSPIFGLTDQRPSFPRLGVLRKGAARTEQDVERKRPGGDLTHFRLVDAADAEVEAAFQAVYGTEPTAINIYLPYPTVDENFDCWMEVWGAAGLDRRCNRQQVVLWYDQRARKMSQAPRACEFGQCECKQVGRLTVIVEEMRRLGHFTVLTSSIHDIINLTRQLQGVQLLREGHPMGLRGIPFVLSRRPVKITTPGGKSGKRARREKWLLSLEVSPRWASRALAYEERLALPGGSSEPALEPEVLQAEVVDVPPPADYQPADDWRRGAVAPDPDSDDWDSEAAASFDDGDPVETPPRPASLEEVGAFVHQVRALVAEKEARWPGAAETAASEKQVGYVAGLLAAGPADKDLGRAQRAVLLDLLFDRDLEHLTSAQASAIIDWCRQTTGYAGKLQRLTALAQGQEALPL